MQIVTRTIKHTSRSDVFKITPLSCIHWGGRDCHKSLLRACIRRIAEDENHYWILMGDAIEAINPTDKRSDLAELDPSTTLEQLQDLAYSQIKGIAGELDPIRGKCLGILTGNHEEKLRIRYFADAHARLCELLQNDFGDLNLDYSAFIRWKFVRGARNSATSRDVIIWAHHGAGGGRKTGGVVNRLEDMPLYFPDADIYIMAHVHRRIAFIQDAVSIGRRADKLVEIHRALGCTGTFKKTYEQGCRGYGEKAQLQPSPLGVVSFIIKPASDNENNPRGITIDTHSSTSGLPA